MIYGVILCAGFLMLGFCLGVRAAWWAQRRHDRIVIVRLREHIRQYWEAHQPPAAADDPSRN